MAGGNDDFGPHKVDQVMLRAFAKGELDEAAEDRVLALLEERPELQAKVAAISIDPVLERMRAYSRVASRGLSAGQGAKEGRRADEPEVAIAQPTDIPRELEASSEFRVLKELGRGGMGVVYLAENRWMGGRKEVLKVLNERLIGDEGAKSRFQKEIEITAKLNHPAIVKSHSVRPLENATVFVMEYVEGVTLHEFIASEGKLSPHVACGIAMDVCGGLQHAMKRGAIHRDIKPSNLMLYKSSDGRLHAKILDFGLARATNNESKGLTRDGTLLGTLEYIAPEQSLDANKADIRADIYSLGCTLYHMLAGRPPFTGTTGQLILAHSQKTPESLHKVRPSIPVSLSDLVDVMLQKRPQRRFQTPAEVAKAIKPYTKKAAEAPLPKPPRESPTPPETTGPAGEALQDTSIELVRSGTKLEQSDENRQEIVSAFKPDSYKTRLREKQQSRPWVISAFLWLGGIAAVALIAWLTLVWTESQAKGGIITIENLPVSARVLIDGEEARISWRGREAIVRAIAGEREIEVRVGDALIEGGGVAVRPDAESRFVVRDRAASGLGNRDLAVKTLARLVPPESSPVWDLTDNKLHVNESFFGTVHDSQQRLLFFGQPGWKDYDLTVDIKIDPGKVQAAGLLLACDEQRQSYWCLTFCPFYNKTGPC